MDPLLAALPRAEHRDFGGAHIDIVRTGNARVGRVVYPPGFRWSTHMKARGHVQGAYADGCTFDLSAPRVVAFHPGHDAWVVGVESTVLIQFDAEGDTCRRFGLPEGHRHS